MGDITKLPRWAQDEIERLTREALSWKGQALAASSAGGGMTDTVLRRRPEPDRGLPMGATVAFKGISGEVEVRMECGGGRVELRAPNGSLVVEPFTSNVVVVSSKPYYDPKA
jgi:hypothetical protein